MGNNKTIKIVKNISIIVIVIILAAKGCFFLLTHHLAEYCGVSPDDKYLMLEHTKFEQSFVIGNDRFYFALTKSWKERPENTDAILKNVTLKLFKSSDFEKSIPFEQITYKTDSGKYEIYSKGDSIQKTSLSPLADSLQKENWVRSKVCPIYPVKDTARLWSNIEEVLFNFNNISAKEYVLVVEYNYRFMALPYTVSHTYNLRRKSTWVENSFLF